MKCAVYHCDWIARSDAYAQPTEVAQPDHKSFAIQPNETHHLILMEPFRWLLSQLEKNWMLMAHISCVLWVNKFQDKIRASSFRNVKPKCRTDTYEPQPERTECECEMVARTKKKPGEIIRIKQMCCKRRRSACNCISDNTSYCLPYSVLVATGTRSAATRPKLSFTMNLYSISFWRT